MNRAKLMPLFFCLLIFTGAMHSETTSQADKNALAGQIMSWSQSMKTFSGVFSLETIKPEGAENTAITRGRIEYRTDGKNFYLMLEDESSPGRVKRDYHTYLRGTEKYLSITVEDGHPASGYTTVNENANGKLPFPWGVYILPDAVFGAYHRHTLADVFSQGESRLLSRDGELVLVHQNDAISRAVNIFFDENMRVKKYEWVSRPVFEDPEKLADIYQGDIHDLQILKITLELTDYANIDGVEYPLTVTKTWWTMDEAQIEAINREYESGLIGQAELLVKMYSLPAVVMQKQVVNVETCSINKELHDSDFELPPQSDNYPVFDSAGVMTHDPHTSPQWWIVLGGAAIVAVIVAISGGLYAKRKSKKRDTSPN